MNVVKIGGPVYRIGVGGGSASSIQVQGDKASELVFGAVQSGDAEMEQKLNRAIRGCTEMKDKNPICSIHDQGAGGNGNRTLSCLLTPLLNCPCPPDCVSLSSRLSVTVCLTVSQALNV